ncbi:MAG: HAD family hydrolase [Rhizobiaceae bacterium]|nr:HAD family hydrolase [Rhizobiaceae bacterium]
MNIEAVLFDKDGTLIDFDATFNPAVEHVIKTISNGDQSLSEEIARLWDFDLKSGEIGAQSVIIAGSGYDITAAVAPLLGVDDVAALSRKIDALYGEICKETVEALPGVEATLFALKDQKFVTGIATNDAQENAEAQMNTLKFTDFFDRILGADSGYGAKPAPGMILGFCELTDIAPENTLMVGDSLHDLKAGKAAGVFTCGVETGPATAEELAPFADVVLPTAALLPEWLQSM